MSDSAFAVAASAVNSYTRARTLEDGFYRRIMPAYRFHGDGWGEEELGYTAQFHLERVERDRRFAARELTRSEYRTYLWQLETDRYRSAQREYDVAARDAAGYALFCELAGLAGCAAPTEV